MDGLAAPLSPSRGVLSPQRREALAVTGQRIRTRWAAIKHGWSLIPRWVIWLVFVIVALAVGFYLYFNTPFLKEAFHAVEQASPGWLVACLLASFASMFSFAAVQWTLLRAAGVDSPFWRNSAIVFASNALSGSIPGGPVLGTALTFRETKKLGATTIIATWQLVIAGVLATVGLTILGLGGVIFVGTTSNPWLLGLALIALVAFMWLVQWAMRNPHRLESTLQPIVVWGAAKRHKDPTPLLTKVHATVRQVEAVKLRRTELGKAFGWSFFNWVADVACMGFAAYSVGARPSVGGMSIAYVTSKIVGSAPVTPGGFGTVDGTLVWALTLGGLTASYALATVLVYRLISFVLMVAIGWVLVAVLFRGATKDASIVTEYTETTEELADEDFSGISSLELRHRRVQEKFDRQREQEAARRQAAAAAEAKETSPLSSSTAEPSPTES